MIDFRIENNLLILIYSYHPNVSWVFYKLKHGENKANIKRTFTFEENDLYKPSYDENEPIEFIFAKLDGDYFKVEKRILSIDQFLFIHEKVELSLNFFIAEQSISVFKKISKLVSEDIYIGGNKESNIPERRFNQLIKDFPNTSEIKKYVDARLSTVLRDYFDTAVDGGKKYNDYMNKKVSQKGEDLTSIFIGSELEKYKTILEKLEKMLEDEKAYNEKQWQKEILQIILLLYPKYIRVFEEVQIKDTYNNKKRRLDYLLVDSNGNTDIVEIKRPFGSHIVSKSETRDNYTPHKDLSGTIMQIEKYIFYLNKWGKTGEDALTKKYKTEFPDGFEIKITNPSGFVIMGRENKLNAKQKQDFEVIKRKYKNIIDIITYDDLLSRLQFTIKQLNKTKESHNKCD